MVSQSDLLALRKLFQSSKVLSTPQICSILGCSSRTAQKFLSELNCLRSYNKNAAYLTLPDIPSFNPSGLWVFEGIGFSEFGNLRETVVQLIHRSSAGLAVSDISELMGVNAHSFMSQLRKDPRLLREKWDSSLIYFASVDSRRSAQKIERSRSHSAPAFPSDAQATAILVELLKHPDASIEELADIIKPLFPRIDFGMIERLLAYHGLIKRKESAPARPQSP